MSEPPPGRAPAIRATPVRLLSLDSAAADPGWRRNRQTFRPLVAGPAILYRTHAAGPWSVDVDMESLVPACPRTVAGIADVVRFHESFGRRCRIGAALAVPADSRRPGGSRGSPHRSRTIDIYGWAILYQLPGMTGVAFVDRHERVDELPACYECPFELLDRSEFLASRGIRHRPLAIVTRPEDFSVDRRGARVNILHPTARCRPPCTISRLLHG